MPSLLPPSRSALEQAAADSLAEIERVPVPLRDLWNPDTCPVDLLPHLAWALSVDRWDQEWPENVKRDVVRASYSVHRRKGTITAMRRVIEPLGYLLNLTEWWQTDPPGPRGTFQMDISVKDQGITERTFEEMERLIDDAKPLTRHLVGLAIKLFTQGTLHIGAAEYSGDSMTVYPFPSGPIEVRGDTYLGAGQHIIDTVSVNHG